MPRVLLLLFLSFIAPHGVGAANQPAPASPQTPPLFRPDEVIIKLKPPTGSLTTAKALVDKITTTHKLSKSQYLNRSPVADSQVFKLTLNSNSSPQQVSRQIKSDYPQIAFAEPNYIYHLAQTPPTPSQPPISFQQWNLSAIQLPTVLPPNLSQVLVAVIDSGIDYTHPSLGSCTLAQVNANTCAKIMPGYDYTNLKLDTMDSLGHGTHVAGTIASLPVPSLGFVGISPNARILPLKVFDSSGEASLADLVLAIDDAVASGAKIINASWSGPGSSLMLADTIANASNRGALFVAAAGNATDDTSRSYPSGTTCSTTTNPSFDCVLTVSSTNLSGTRSQFSNWGGLLDIAAPGGGNNPILSLKSSQATKFPPSQIVDTNYLLLSGTSMAAPHVTALAALLLGKNPSLTPLAVRNIILNSAADLGTVGFDNYFAYGQIDIKKALTTPDTSTPPTTRITSPYPYMRIGRAFSISGSVDGPGFQNYSISYATSTSGPWSSVGVTYSGSNATVKYNSVLAILNLSTQTSGTYYLRLTVATATKTSSTLLPIMLDTQVLPGFPLPFGSHTLEIKPAIADINSDGKSDIIYKDSVHGLINVTNSQANSLPGWPQSATEYYPGQYRSSTPMLVDLDPNYPGLELFLPISQTGWGGQIIGFHADGTPIPNWTAASWTARGNLGYPHDSISGYAQGSTRFLVFAEASSGWSDIAERVHVLDASANYLPGWPVSLPVDTTNSSDVVLATPAIADLDLDGVPEIIVTLYAKKILVYALTGQLKYTITLPANESLSGTSGSSFLGVANVDASPQPEIIAAANYWPTDSTFPTGSNVPTIRKIYVWDHTGNPKAPWPKTLPDPPGLQPYWYVFVTNVNLTDLDHDGVTDIQVSLSVNYTEGQYFAYSGTGQLLPGFPKVGGTNSDYSVNGFLASGKHFAIDEGFSGTTPKQANLTLYTPGSGTFSSDPNFPKPFYFVPDYRNNHIGSSSVADITDDGLLDYVVPVLYGSTHWSITHLYAFSLGLAAQNLDWPQYLHNAAHTSSLASPPLQVKFRLQTVSSQKPNQLATVTLRQGASITQTFPNVPFTSDATGLFSASITPVSLPATYDIYISKPGFLTQKTTSVSTTVPTLLAGDFTGDNTLNLSDITTLLSSYTSLKTPLTTANVKYDVNLDNFITILDISPVLHNYAQLQVPGD